MDGQGLYLLVMSSGTTCLVTCGHLQKRSDPHVAAHKVLQYSKKWGTGSSLCVGHTVDL